MKKRVAVLSACIALGVTSAHAGNVDTFGIGSRATALGGAYSATADDPFAAYYNPAGLSQLEGKMASAGAQVVMPTIDISNFYVENRTGIDNFGDPTVPQTSTSAKDFSADCDPLIAPHLGYAQKLTDKIALGVAAYAPWGMVLEWDKDPNKNPGAWNYYKSYYIREVATPTLSYKVNDKFSVGVGVSIGRSLAGASTLLYTASPEDIAALTAAKTKAEGIRTALTAVGADLTEINQTITALTTSLAQASATAPLHGQAVEVEMEDDFNTSFNVGFMYKPTNTVTLGLTYRSEADASFDGDAEFMGIDAAKVELDYDHPQQIQAGIRYQPHDRFSMEFDLTWTEWSIGDTQTEPFTSNGSAQGDQLVALLNASGNNPLTSERNWEDTKQIRFGAEYILNDLITLRGGYFYDPTPIPNDTLDLQWADADKKTYSLGTGINLDPVTIDLVFQYTDIEKPAMVGGETKNINKSYYQGKSRANLEADGYITSFGVTVNYKF